MATNTHERIEAALGIAVVKSVPLSGGYIGDVRVLELAGGQRVVVKTGGTHLDLEGWMLTYLARRSTLPVPDVRLAERDLLVMSYLETAGGITAEAQEEAAGHLVRLHNIKGESFGLDRDTVIGGLHQPNTPETSWRTFFVEQRLLHMGRLALDKGRLPAPTLRRLETLCGSLGRWIEEPPYPSLIHGDMWTGNVLCNGGRIAGFVDPAIYYADPEIELAFSTLFGTFGDTFFKRYEEHRPLAPGFFEERRDLYNLYPLLVHVCLFGGSYLKNVEQTLTQFGV